MALGDIKDLTYDVDTVEDRMTGLLSKNSPYIKQAKSDAMKTANSRGLLNSSIAAGAGTDAAIRSSLPIASQDATASNQFGLQKYGQEATESLLGTESGLKSQLMSEEAGYKSGLSGQEATQKLEQQSQKYDFENQLQNSKFTSDEVRAIGSSTTLLGESLTNRIAEIQKDATLSASAKSTIVQQLQDIYKSQLDSIGAIYGVPIEWSSPGAAQGQSPARKLLTISSALMSRIAD
jgi:hypothetical protein